MNGLWFIPPLVLLAGTVVLALLVARLGNAIDELRGTLFRMGEVRQAVIELRVETDATRASLDHLRRR